MVCTMYLVHCIHGLEHLILAPYLLGPSIASGSQLHLFSAVLRIEATALHLPGKQSDSELHP